MCGRLTQHSLSSAYRDLFGIEADLGEIPPRYNLAPSQPILVARAAANGKRELTYLRWGLVPAWSKGPARPRRGAGVPSGDATAGGRAESLDGHSPHRGSDPSSSAAGAPLRLSGLDSRFSMINARAETVDQKPAYRGPFRYRRCLIPTEGFYEWKPEQGGKQPYLIGLQSGRPFALAGLWDQWQDPNGSALESCSIIVTDANPLIAPIHDRMPVVLPPEVWDRWLDPHQQDTRSLRPLLVPCDPSSLQVYPVSRAVNNTRNDDPSLIEPV